MARVAVVGGGMAGVACAIQLADNDVQVTVVDRNDYLQFQPLLYQVASSQLPAEDIARPHEVIFSGSSTVTAVTAEVTRLDLGGRTLVTTDSIIGPVDYLVLAAGSRPNFFGVKGADEHSFPLYSVADAERLRLHLREQLRRGSDLTRTGGAIGPLTVVIVGGGPTGVETAGAIAELLHTLRAQDLIPGDYSVRLVDHGSALLAPFSAKSHQYALDKLTEKGVTVTFGVAVTVVEPDAVHLSDGSTVPTDTVIWGGGESAAAITANSKAGLGRAGRIDVATDLTIPGFPGTFAVGDVANIPGPDGHPLPQLGSVAQQSGKWAADNILADLAGDPMRPFRYRDKGIMAMVGRNCAIAEVGPHRHQIEGPLAFAAWLGLHAVLLSGAHSRVDAFLTWADDYLHRDRSADLEIDGQPSRIAWGDDRADRPRLTVGVGG